MFAILDDLGFQEIFVIMIAAVLFWGKRLPEVASQAGAQLAKFKKSLQDLKTETGIDHEVRKLQRTIEDAIPRDISFEDMARAASAKIDERRKTNEESTEPKLPPESVPATQSPSSNDGPKASEAPPPIENHTPTENHALAENATLTASESEPVRERDPSQGNRIPRAS